MADAKIKKEEITNKNDGDIIYVRISSFMFNGKVQKAEFDKKEKLHFFKIDKNTSEKLEASIRRKQIRK